MEMTNDEVNVVVLTGIFGEGINGSGIMEGSIIHPLEGGEFVKVMGCSYLYKGYPDEQKVFGMEQAKSNISAFPRDIIGHSFLYSVSLMLRYLFQRKKFIHDLHLFFEEIMQRTISHCGKPLIYHNVFTKEIIRAMDISLKKELNLPFNMQLVSYSPQATKWLYYEFAVLMTKITAFICLLFERDSAYRFPMQDILGNKNTKNANHSGYKEAMRLFNLMLERQTNFTLVKGISDRTEGVPHKYRFVKKVFQIFLLSNSRARRITQNFLKELNADKVKLDEADWYFCLGRNTHNYGGIPLPVRLEELKRVDKEKSHYYAEINYVFKREMNYGENVKDEQDLRQRYSNMITSIFSILLKKKSEEIEKKIGDSEYTTDVKKLVLSVLLN